MAQTHDSADMAGRIAVITGASAGIGEATARLIAARGGRVIVNARRAELLEKLTDEINSAAGERRCVAVAGDASERSVIDRCLDAAAEAFGNPANAAIVNAGVGLRGGMLSSDAAKWEAMVRLNVLGAMHMMRASAERMIADIESRGDWLAVPHDIVVLGSTVGKHVSPFSGAYGSTKFAVHGAVEALRREICPKGVRVTVVEPGIVVSEFQDSAGYDPDWFADMSKDMQPLIESEDVARTIGHVLALPAHVHVNEFMIRATRQAYP